MQQQRPCLAQNEHHFLLREPAKASECISCALLIMMDIPPLTCASTTHKSCNRNTTTRRKLSRSRDAERRPMRITRATGTRKQKHAVLSCCLPVSAIGNIFNHDVTVSLCEGERERGGAPYFHSSRLDYKYNRVNRHN